MLGLCRGHQVNSALEKGLCALALCPQGSKTVSCVAGRCQLPTWRDFGRRLEGKGGYPGHLAKGWTVHSRETLERRGWRTLKQDAGDRITRDMRQVGEGGLKEGQSQRMGNRGPGEGRMNSWW